jgi:similar to stage IV sporulation protein
MKHKQGIFVKGYITICIEGSRPESFLNKCMKANIPLWDIKRISDKQCEAKIHLKNVKKLKQIRRKTEYKISFKEKFGLPFIIGQFKYRKPMLIGLIMSIFVIFTLSNIVWDVKIVGVSPEMEYKIKQRLEHYGLRKGIFKFSVDSLDDIERNITNELNDVMWIGIEEKGTTYIVQGVEKSIVSKEEDNSPQHLVASHEGEIVQLLVESGQPLVKVNQHVDKGDILVSGLIGEEKSQNVNGEDQTTPKQRVHAEGKVYARTMYLAETTVDLNYEYETLTGKQDDQYKLKIAKWSIPVWDIFKPDFRVSYEESEQKNLYFLNMKLPFSIEKKTFYEQEKISGVRTEKEAVAEGIEQAKRELKKQMDYDAEILDVKILQQSKENGKVKLKLYFVAKENIAKPQPINQGD